jgi:hypothetical protein
MARLDSLPITLVASIKPGSITVNTFYNNTGSTYHGYGYTFNCTLIVNTTLTSDDRITPNPYAYDAYHVYEGMWIGQTTGASYKIISTSSPTSATEIDVVLKDVGLYNLLADPSFSGFNTPSEGNNGLLFYLSNDGDPILSGLQILQPLLPDINYFVNDMYAKFQYRNLTTTYYNNNDTNLVYGTGYSVNQIVYLDSTGKFQLVDVTNATQVEKSFGVITTVNEPEDGNMTVKPFGEIKGGLTLTGFSIGDVLYYDATATATSFVTSTKPTDAYPLYIKVSNNVGSFIGGQSTGGSGTSGTSGESGTSGSSGSSGTSGTSGTSGSSGTSGESGTSGSSGSSGSDGSSGTSGDSLFISGAGFYYTTNNLEVTGSVKIKGTLTADEYNVSVVSSSILFSSGSTKFGDTQDDTHVFTGSLITTGSLTINGDLTVNGTSILKAIDSRESLIVSGAMNIVSNNVNASVVSASLAFESVKAIEQIINITTMDLGYF